MTEDGNGAAIRDGAYSGDGAMQTVTDGGQGFGPVTDKLMNDLLAAGMRLTAQVQDHPEQLNNRLHAYTVEITTALAVAVGRLETELHESAGQPAARRRTRRDGTAAHLSLVKNLPSVGT